MGFLAYHCIACCFTAGLLSLDDHIHIEDHLGGHLSSQLAPDHDEEFTQELDFFLSGQNYHHTVFKMEVCWLCWVACLSIAGAWQGARMPALLVLNNYSAEDVVRRIWLCPCAVNIVSKLPSCVKLPAFGDAFVQATQPRF